MRDITIFEDEIKQAAGIIKKADGGDEYTDEQWNDATFVWLQDVINSVLSDANDYAIGPHPIGRFKIPLS